MILRLEMLINLHLAVEHANLPDAVSFVVGMHKIR